MAKGSAIIRQEDGKYTAKLTGIRRIWNETFDDFSAAYRAACEHVGWDYNFIDIQIYPPDIEAAMMTIHDERKRQEEVETKEREWFEYLRLKRRFEDEDDGSDSQ